MIDSQTITITMTTISMLNGRARIESLLTSRAIGGGWSIEVEVIHFDEASDSFEPYTFHQSFLRECDAERLATAIANDGTINLALWIPTAAINCQRAWDEVGGNWNKPA